MRAAKISLPLRLRKPIRLTVALATLCLVGIVGTQAAETHTISLSEDVCLSCAYEDGLGRPTAAIFEDVQVDAVAGTAAEVSDDRSSSFGSLGVERPQIVLPSGASDRSERLRFSAGEKTLLWSLVSLSAVDAYQTMNAPGDFREANPLLGAWAGDHPSALETLAFKGATTYTMIKLTGKIKKRSTRRLALVLMNVVQLSVTAHNEEVTGGILF